MIIKDATKKILFNTYIEAVNSSYTDEELLDMREYHLREAKSYTSINDYNHAMDHATQAQFCREAVEKRNSTKSIL